MPPTQHQTRPVTGRAVPSNTDLALIARANARGPMRLSDDDLAALMRSAELLGCDHAVRKIREAIDRRALQPDLQPVPDVGGRRRASAPNRPILVALEGDLAGETSADRRRAHFLRMARVAEDGAAAPWATRLESASFALAAERCRRAADD